MSSWAGTTYKRSEDQASIQATAFWIWQLESGAYPALMECYGDEFGGLPCHRIRQNLVNCCMIFNQCYQTAHFVNVTCKSIAIVIS